MDENDRYFKEERIDLKKYFDENDFEKMKKINISITKDCITEHELDLIKGKLNIYNPNKKEKEDRLKCIKFLKNKEITLQQFEKIIEKLENVYYYEVFKKFPNYSDIKVSTLSELDSAFFYRQSDLEREALNRYSSEIRFNEHLEIQDKIKEVLVKNNVNSEVISIIEKMFLKQYIAFGIELEFWEMFFFKAGISYICSLKNEINTEIQEYKSLNNK